MKLVSCRDVEKIYGSGASQVVALKGIDLDLEQGEFVAVIGASGSGKSTLLHILGSVESPTKGSVVIDGVKLESLNATQAAIFRRTKVGIIYQFYNLIPTLTVKKNILMPILLDKKQVDQEYFVRLVEVLGLGEKLDAMPHQLSGGQKQRVAIARALLYRPALVLADEPTGNLDQKNSKELLELLKLANTQFGQTILLITHDEQIAAQTNRVITIADGRIVKAEKIIKDEKMVKDEKSIKSEKKREVDVCGQNMP